MVNYDPIMSGPWVKRKPFMAGPHEWAENGWNYTLDGNRGPERVSSLLKAELNNG